MKIFFILSFTLFFLYSCNTTKINPNIIVIMADDLGYEGISSFGNKIIKTPNLDKLANQGIKFTDFHSNGTVCTPTRAAFLTGLYPQRSGLEGVIYAKGETRALGLDPNSITIADVLKENSYATSIIGKWHLGYKPKYNPIHYGFDDFFGYVSGNIDFHTHRDGAGYYDWYHNTDTIIETGYTTDLITKHSVNFIKKNKHNPFFLFVSHEAPHVPFQGRNDPGFRKSPKEADYYGPVKDTDRAYKEMIEIMDEGIGSIIETLEKEGILENTLVFFLSDNGAREFGHNGVLKGDKGSLFEGGHRVPAIAYWKNKIQSNISNQILMGFDLFPTIISILGIKINDKLILDGVDFSPILFNSKYKSIARELYWRYRGQKAIRMNNNKLLITNNDTLLFDLSNDLQEIIDLKNKNTDLTKTLVEKIIKWELEMDKYPEITN